MEDKLISSTAFGDFLLHLTESFLYKLDSIASITIQLLLHIFIFFPKKIKSDMKSIRFSLYRNLLPLILVVVFCLIPLE